MAKNLAKNRSSNAKKLARLYREKNWTQQEIDELDAVFAGKKQRQMDRFLRAANRKLEKSAFEACDKAWYAEEIMNDKLLSYDVRAYRNQRAVNHRAAKAIFKAVREGTSYEAALQRHASETETLRAKREAYRHKLEGERDAFVAKHGPADSTSYDTLSKKLEKDHAAMEQAGDSRIAAKHQAKRQKLEKKRASIDSRIRQLKSATAGDSVLPQDVLLRVRGLKMYFGGLKAVDDLTFDVKKGEIFGLIGPNGAGKTTVFNCITRFYDATAGDMFFENTQGETVDLRHFQVHDIITQGISRTFQNVELVKEISVLENLLVACTREYRSGLLVQALGLPRLRREERRLKEKANRILKFMDLERYAGWLAMGLPYGILKKVEIARALMSDARLIIMDEPAAGLNDTETAELTQTIRRIRDEFGVTILLVEHDMSLVMNVCDTVCAISFGKMLAIGTCQQIKSNKAVQEAYLGVEEDGQ